MPSSSGSNHESTVQSYLQRACYQNVESTKRDAVLALKHYRGLQPKLDWFVFNDGRRRNLLSLEGTIPVPYKGSSYNIPVAIWVLDTHPLHAPICYVKPTPDMQIKVSQNVDQNGKVYLPYLHEWSGSSDILSLVQMCIITFSEEPPVFSRMPGQAAAAAATAQPPQPRMNPAYPMPPYPTQEQQQRMPYPPYPTSQQSQPAGYPPQVYPPAPNPMGGGMPPYPPAYGQPSNGGGTISQELIKASLQTAVEDKIRRALADDYATKQAEIQNLEKMEEELTMGKHQLESTLHRLDCENQELDRICTSLQSEKNGLELALTKFENSDETTEDSIDEKIVTVTPLFKQIVSCYSEELAISDAIYYLSEALRKDQLDCDSFLKQVRALSRKQFFLRATMQKAREKAGLQSS